MTYTPPATGSTVRYVIEGIIEHADATSTIFEGGIQVETPGDLYDETVVSYEVVTPTPKNGAVGIYYDYLSKREVVLFRSDSDVSSCGWFTAGGDKVQSFRVRPLSMNQQVELLFSQDKVKLPSEVKEARRSFDSLSADSTD